MCAVKGILEKTLGFGPNPIHVSDCNCLLFLVHESCGVKFKIPSSYTCMQI